MANMNALQKKDTDVQFDPRHRVHSGRSLGMRVAAAGAALLAAGCSAKAATATTSAEKTSSGNGAAAASPNPGQTGSKKPVQTAASAPDYSQTPKVIDPCDIKGMETATANALKSRYDDGARVVLGSCVLFTAETTGQANVVTGFQWNAKIIEGSKTSITAFQDVLTRGGGSTSVEGIQSLPSGSRYTRLSVSQNLGNLILYIDQPFGESLDGGTDDAKYLDQTYGPPGTLDISDYSANGGQGNAQAQADIEATKVPMGLLVAAAF
jgi:hypothetical protein